MRFKQGFEASTSWTVYGPVMRVVPVFVFDCRADYLAALAAHHAQWP